MRLDIIDHEVENFLDESLQLRVDKILERDWKAIPMVGFPTIIEAEWLSNAIKSKTNNDIRVIYFEFEPSRSFERIKNTSHEILMCFQKHSYEYLMMYDNNLNFIIYKEQNNRYYIVASEGDFIDLARPYSFDVYKENYNNIISDPINSKDERRFMENIWKKYV